METRLHFSRFFIPQLMLLSISFLVSFAVCAQTIHEVSLLDFAAKHGKDKVTLNWATKHQKQLSHFIVESSNDGVHFKDIGIVFTSDPSDNKQDYAIKDPNPGNRGDVYYRLRMVDFNGNQTYSPVRAISLDAQKQAITVTTYPNPVSNNLKIGIPSSWQNKLVKMELYSTKSHQKVKELIRAKAGQTEMIAISDLGKGLYVLMVTCENETVQEKIVKN